MFRRIFVFLVLMVAFVPAVQAQNSTPVDQTLFLTYVPNIQFAPVYVGLEKGYYTDAGIKLNIQHGDENVGVDLIAAGHLQFGIISGEEVIKARANSRPVYFVYEWFQKYPVGIVVSADAGINAVKDLVGHSVGLPGRFGASYNGLTALLAASGLKETDIQLQEIGYNAPDVFCLGKVDAAVVYINNEPMQIQQRADQGKCGRVKQVKVLPVSDAADLVSNGLVTNEDTAAKNPDLVRGMVAAFDKGLRDAINNPAEAYLLSAPHVDGLPLPENFKAALEQAAADQNKLLATNPDRAAVAASRAALLKTLQAGQYDADAMIQFQVLLNTIDLWDADRLGYSDLSSWEVTQRTLQAMDFVSKPIDLQAAFTNDFLPAEK
jgi:NitT/TauT family transport system substrate-binding protein